MARTAAGTPDVVVWARTRQQTPALGEVERRVLLESTAAPRNRGWARLARSPLATVALLVVALGPPGVLVSVLLGAAGDGSRFGLDDDVARVLAVVWLVVTLGWQGTLVAGALDPSTRWSAVASGSAITVVLVVPALLLAEHAGPSLGTWSLLGWSLVAASFATVVIAVARRGSKATAQRAATPPDALPFDPSSLDVRETARMLARRRQVLDTLVQRGTLDERTAGAAAQQPLGGLSSFDP